MTKIRVKKMVGENVYYVCMYGWLKNIIGRKEVAKTL